MFAYERQRRFNVCCRASSKNDVDCDTSAKISRANRNNAACRKRDNPWTRMPADRETRLARHWDRLDEPRTSGSQFRGCCAANPECLWPAAVFAFFLAALDTQILGRLGFVSSIHQPSPRTRVGRLILQG